MNYRICLLLFLALLWNSSSKANPRVISASEFLQPSQPTSLSISSQATYYTVDGALLTKALLTAGHISISDFPGGAGDLVTLDLKPAHSPIDSTTQFWIGSTQGTQRFTPPSFSAFRGKVLGEPDSRVFLTTFAGKLLVTITRESGITYDFGPAKNSEERGAHILIPENSLLASGPFHPLNCIAGDIPQPNAPEPVEELLREYRSKNMQALGGISHSQLLQVNIAVEADSCFYHAAGNDTNTVLGYIASLFAASSSIYENEVHITWHLTWVKLWPKGDPYNVAGNAYALEDTVPIYWRAHYADVPRDCAHVMTSIGYGGGGFGYYSMCDPQWSYSVSSPQTGHSYPTFAFTYDAYIVAHEIGHNFSLVHSHCCYWDPPLDTCYTKDDTIWGLRLGDACDSLPIIPHKNPGSIMSYCANANYAISGKDFSQYKLAMTFTPKVDSVLRMNAENSACIQPPVDSAFIVLLSPGGSETLRGDTTISIEWTYANVDSISLEYSSDGGSTWNPIASNLNAMTGHTNWIVPNISSQEMLVRAFDPSAQRIADTSLTFFTVAQNSSVGGATGPNGIDLQLYPNPAQDVLTLTGGVAGERIEYSIVNINGENILSGSAVENASALRIALPPLANGTYYLRITSPIARVFPFIHSK
ncbi:MAG TPA: M12 family metallo-peptidase [Candidatus Kapabacteria bacterium]|nr:M12 family metallo-peptidase [Candidatus Kapabacteria bacterium]